MNDETEKRPAWPPNRPNRDAKPVTASTPVAPPRPASLLSKMKARPNWDDTTSDYVADEGTDRLKIPREIIDKFARDGVALQWITRSVRGQDAPQEISKFAKGGWTPVHQSDFDGVFDGMFMPKGTDDVVGVDDCLLVARPMEIQRKSRQREQHMANEPLRIKQQEFGSGLNMPGGQHPSAVRQNRINITREGIEVPTDALGMAE